MNQEDEARGVYRAFVKERNAQGNAWTIALIAALGVAAFMWYRFHSPAVAVVAALVAAALGYWVGYKFSTIINLIFGAGVIALLAWGLLAWLGTSQPAANSLLLATSTQNPFGLPHEPIPDGEDADALLMNAPLPGGDADPNAEIWPTEIMAENFEALDGKWDCRWRSSKNPEWHLNTVPTEVAAKGDLLFIRYTDRWGTYVMVLRKRDEQQFAGHYIQTDHLSVVSPFAARVVSTERIDGFWIDDGGNIARWDLRRRTQ